MKTLFALIILAPNGYGSSYDVTPGFYSMRACQSMMREVTEFYEDKGRLLDTEPEMKCVPYEDASSDE